MAQQRDERGMSNSVQAAVLFPLFFALFLGLLQWALITWAEASALAGAQHGAAVAARHAATAGEGHSAALGAADNGSLVAVEVRVERGARETTATVSGRALVVLWPKEVTKTVVVATERLTR